MAKEVMGESLYKLVNAMAGKEVTAQEIADATANKTFGDVANDLTAGIAGKIGEVVKTAPPVLSRSNPILVIPQADLIAILGGEINEYLVDEADFIPGPDFESTLDYVNSYPVELPFKVETTPNPSYGVFTFRAFSTVVSYSAVVNFGGTLYVVTVNVNFILNAKQWQFTVSAVAI